MLPRTDETKCESAFVKTEKRNDVVFTFFIFCICINDHIFIYEIYLKEESFRNEQAYL